MRILVLGAGFGGFELTTTLSEALGDEVEITLIDKSDHFVFGFSKLDVMFGKAVAEQVKHPYAGRVKPGVEFVQAKITSIDAAAKRVETEAGTFEADLLVVAPARTSTPTPRPACSRAATSWPSEPGAFALRDVLAGFGGGRVVVAVTSTPFGRPPAPSETALLMHDYLTERGVRDSSEIALVMPMGVPIPPSPEASAALLTAFEERGIAWHPERVVRSLDPARKVAVCADGVELPYDLFLGVPVHRAPAVVQESGMCVDGWIPVDPLTLETAFDGVYAVGDVTSVGTPKAGVFAEGQAAVVAAAIIARAADAEAGHTYDGRGICYLEFGRDQVAKGRGDVRQRTDAQRQASRGRPPCSRRTRRPSEPTGSVADPTAPGRPERTRDASPG